jgi:hypothetical protein
MKDAYGRVIDFVIRRWVLLRLCQMINGPDWKERSSHRGFERG